MRPNGQMTTYPYEVIDVPTGLSYPSFSADEVCNWNIVIEAEECTNPDFDGIKIFFKGTWNTPKYKTTRETSEDGYGGEKTELVRVDPIYSFDTTSDNYMLDYLHQILLTSESYRIEDKNGSPFQGREFNIKYEEVDRGTFNVTIEFIAIREDTYHSAFGHKACCKSLYENAPYEGCAEDAGGGIDNEEPMCDDIIFSITNDNGTLTASAENTPSSFTISWYYRENASQAWRYLDTGSVLTVGNYGIYRSVMNALGCGQYVDQYIFMNPCDGFDVRIRKNASGNVLVAEANQLSQYTWEFNDGTGWVILSESSNALMYEETGTYRVTADNGECSDSDAIFATYNSTACDITADIEIEGTTATAVTDAESPTYQWLFEDESGTNEIGTGSSIQLTDTGIYWLNVIDGQCVISRHKFYRSPIETTKIEVVNWDEMPMPQTTLIACCDECPSMSLQVTCVNRTLTLTGLPSGGTVNWVGPNGFTATGYAVTFPQSTPSGLFTATIDLDGCPYSATYIYTKPTAGYANGNPIV